jgi:Dual specificity phosphatase, catalytic domain
MQTCKKCGAEFTTQQELEEHHKESSHMSEVLPGLFVGASWNAESKTELQLSNIHSILSMAQEYGTVLHPELVFRHLPLLDYGFESILPAMIYAINLIHGMREDSMVAHVSPPRGILVHCAIGRSRSVSAVAAYVMWHQGILYPKAIALIRRKRKGAGPNLGYEKQLQALGVLLQGLFTPDAANLRPLAIIADYLEPSPPPIALA